MTHRPLFPLRHRRQNLWGLVQLYKAAEGLAPAKTPLRPKRLANEYELGGKLTSTPQTLWTATSRTTTGVSVFPCATPLITNTLVNPNWLQPCQCCCCLCYPGEYLRLEPSSVITEPRYLKLVIVSSFCLFPLISVLILLVLFVISFVFLALIFML